MINYKFRLNKRIVNISFNIILTHTNVNEKMIIFGNFWENIASSWQFFYIQMAIFWRVKLEPIPIGRALALKTMNILSGIC